MAGVGVAGGVLHMSQSYVHNPMLAGSRGEVGVHLHSCSAKQVSFVFRVAHDGGS